MADSPTPHFRYFDDPDLPGWHRWEMVDDTRFNAFLAPISTRIDGKIARVRMVPRRDHSNLRDHVHGGALLGFIDVAVFAAARAFGVMGEGGASTVDLSTQFIAGADATKPIEAHVEMLRETGRLFFVRGLIVQNDTTIASFSCTARKGTQKPSPLQGRGLGEGQSGVESVTPANTRPPLSPEGERE